MPQKETADVPVRDVGVSMRAEVLDDKLCDGRSEDDAYCYWEFTSRPKNVGPGSRLWVANRGRWVGYFVVCGDDLPDHPKDELQFHSETFVSVDGGPRSPFRGFTYDTPKVDTSNDGKLRDSRSRGTFK